MNSMPPLGLPPRPPRKRNDTSAVDLPASILEDPSQTCSTVEDSNGQSYLEGDLPTWRQFFDTCEDLEVDNESPGIFRVYMAGTRGPLVVFLHGGGHTSLSWGHVAGMMKGTVRMMAYDCRGHGSTLCADEEDFSADRLVEDGIAVIRKVWNRLCEDGRGPLIVMVGHSMGGAIATRLAASGRLPNLQVLVVVDVVEGTAMEALPHMKTVVDRMPSTFSSQKDAISWAIKSGALMNKESAKLSVPSQMIEKDGVWTWRCDLTKTQAFWQEWFSGMSTLFLAAKCVKVLILAGHERLDKELMIAHMQGKFQLQIIPQSGHIIEEDQPGQLAKILSDLVTRYRLDVTLPIPS